MILVDEPLLTYPRGVNAEAILRESRERVDAAPTYVRWYARMSYGIVAPSLPFCPKCGSNGGRYFKGPKRSRRYAVKPPLLWIDHARGEAEWEPGWRYCRNDSWHGQSGTVSVTT